MLFVLRLLLKLQQSFQIGQSTAEWEGFCAARPYLDSCLFVVSRISAFKVLGGPGSPNFLKSPVVGREEI